MERSISLTVIRTGPIARMFARGKAPVWAAACANAASFPMQYRAAARRSARKNLDRMLHSQALLQVIGDAQSVGYDCQRGVHGCAGREEAAVHDVEIVDFVCFAIHVQCGSLWIFAESDGAVLVCNTGERNAVPEKQVSGKQSLMTVMAVDAAFRLLLHQVLELGDQPLVGFFVVGCVLQNDFPVAVERDAIV